MASAMRSVFLTIGLPSWIARLEIPVISRGVETKANLWVDVGSLTIYTGDL